MSKVQVFTVVSDADYSYVEYGIVIETRLCGKDLIVI